MKIEKVEIKNFRSILHGTFEIDQVLAVVGQNNSGKSNILHALESFFHPETQLADYLNGKNSCGLPRKKTSIEITFVDAIAVEFKNWRNHENKVIIRQEFVNNKLSYSIYDFHNNKYESYNGNINDYIDYVLIPIDRVSDVNDDRLSVDSVVYKAIKESLLKLSEKRDTFSAQLKKAYEYINKHAFERIAKDINDYYIASHVSAKIKNAVEIDSTLLMSVLGITISENGKEHPINLCGSGIQSLFVIGIYHYITSQTGVNYIIAIEEPEVNLHPQAQRQFANNILQNNGDNQFLLSTHSPFIIDQLGHQDLLLTRKIKHSKRGFETILTQISKDFFSKYSLEKLAYYKFEGFKNSDFFFSSYVIVTESSTDGNVVELLGKKNGIDLLNNGISLINLGGVGNFKYVYYLLQELNIPHTWILDKDFFLDYKKGEKEKSRDSKGFFQYTMTWSVEKNKLDIINQLFANSFDRDNILKMLTTNHIKALNLMKKYGVISMRFNLEMDLCSSEKACEFYYELLHIPKTNRNVRTLLIDNKKAIKGAVYIHEIISKIENKNLPYSFKAIVNLLKSI